MHVYVYVTFNCLLKVRIYSLDRKTYFNITDLIITHKHLGAVQDNMEDTLFSRGRLGVRRLPGGVLPHIAGGRLTPNTFHADM